MHSTSLVENNSSSIKSISLDTFDELSKKTKTKSENRKDYYKYLTRPDGSLFSEKDCLLLDLCIQWTKEGKIATSTYDWLLKNKFPRQNHHVTVKRTFNNISKYIKAEFKNTHIINGKKYTDKIHIERVFDFDLKMNTVITEMSTMVNRNVDPSTYIRKNTLKEYKKRTDIIDIYDTEVTTENIECDETYNELAKAVPSPKTPYTAKRTDSKGPSNTPWTIPLMQFKYSEKMLKEIIAGCNRNRQHYTVDKAIAIIRNILEKHPDKQIYGGIQGFKKYMIAVINGENDYTETGAENKEEQLTSMAELQAKQLLEMNARLANNEINWD